MGTPDLLGTYGTFSFFTSDPFATAGPIAGGAIFRVDVTDNVVRATLEGPDNPLLTQPEKVTRHSPRTSTRRARTQRSSSVRRSGCFEWANGATGCR